MNKSFIYAFSADKKKVGLFVVLGISTIILGVHVFFRPLTSSAGLADEPLGIAGTAEQASISRYLIGDYKFNEQHSHNSNSFIDNIHSLTTLGFDGKNSEPNFIDLTNNGNGLYSFTGDFTIGTWVRLDSVGTEQTLLTQGIASPDSHDFKFYITADNKLAFQVKDNNSNYLTFQSTITDGMKRNIWYFLNVTGEYDSSQNQTNIKLFRNEVEVGNGSFQGSAITTATNNSVLNIGADVDMQDALRGYIDKIYLSHEALSTDEINTWYTNPGRALPIYIPLSSFDGFWEFDEQSGTVAYDKSPQKRDGELRYYNFSGWFRANVNGDKIGAYGIQFDGIDDLISVDAPNQVYEQTDGTIELAFSLNTFPQAGKNMTIFSISDDQPINSFDSIRAYIYSDQKLYVQFVDNGTSTQAYYDKELSLNEWYHLALTFDSSQNTHELFLNGKPAPFTSYTNSNIWFNQMNNERITLGAFYKEKRYQDFFSGSIQHIRNYPQTFSEQAIYTLYNVGYIKTYENIFQSNLTSSFDLDFNQYKTKLYNGTYTDTKGNLKNILIRGPPASNDFTDPTYYQSQGIQFNDTDNYLTVPQTASIRGLAKFSVGILFRYEGDSNPTGKATLYSEEKTTSGMDRFDLFINAAGQIACQVKDKSNNIANALTTDSYTDGLWHLAVCTYNSVNNQVELMLDTEDITTVTVPNLDIIENTIPSNIYIGKKSTGINNQFIGKINDLFVVKDVLTHNQVKNIKASTEKLLHELTSPGETYFLHYKFNEDNSSADKKNSTHIINLDSTDFLVDIYGQSGSQFFDWHNINSKDLSLANIYQSDKLSFDGLNDYIEIKTAEDLSNFDFSPTNTISIEAWIQTTKNNGSIISRNDGQYASFDLSVFDNKPKFTLYSNSTSFSVEGVSEVTDGEWHHLVGTYDGAGQMHIYIDSVLDNTNSVGQISEIQNLDVDINIGASNQGSSGFFEGSIAGIKIYDLSLNHTDIERLYKKRETLHKTNLRLNMELNEGGGRIVYDSTSKQNSGILKEFNNGARFQRQWTNPSNYITLKSPEEYITIENHIIDINENNEFTISLWIKPEDGGGDKYTIIRHGDNGTSDPDFKGYQIDLLPTAITNEYIIDFNVGTNRTNIEESVSFTSDPLFIPKDSWSNIIAYIRNSNELVIPNVLFNSNAISGTFNYVTSGQFQPASNNIYIGIDPDSQNASNFRGSIADFKVYNSQVSNDAFYNLSKSIYSGALEFDESNLINSFNMDEGAGFYVQDAINSDYFGKLQKNTLWSAENMSLVNRKFKRSGSRAVNLNTMSKSHINFGQVLEENTNFAVEIIASVYSLANSTTILDYGFGDEVPNGAKFKIDVTNIGSLRVTISDGETNETNIEAYETTPEIITPGKFFTIIFLYDFSNNQLNLYVDNTLKIHTNTTLSMNSANNHDMSLMISNQINPNNELNIRSLKVATGQTGNNSNILETNAILHAKMNEGNGNILYDSSGYNNHGYIHNIYDWIYIPQSLTNELFDITEKPLDNSFNYNALLDGKNTSIEIKHNKSLEIEKSDFAIEFWLSFSNPFGKYPIIEKGRSIVGNSSVQNSMLLYLDDGKLKGWIGGVAPTVDTNAITLEPEKQYHFILQRDNDLSNSLTLKVNNNGSFENYWNPTLVTASLTNYNNINIGHSRDTRGLAGLNKFFSGQINEIRLIKRAYTNEELLIIPNEPDDLRLMVDLNSGLQDALISRYSFNDTSSEILFDSRSRPNGDGTIKADLVRFYNNGAFFNGNSSYIEIPSDGENKDKIKLNMNNFSIETWVSLNEISKNQIILHKQSSNAQEPNYQISYNTDDGFKFTVSNGIDTYSATTGIENIRTDEPYHIAAIFEEEAYLSLYLNGSLREKTALPSFVPTTSDNPLIFGDDSNHSDDNFLNGSIYKTRFWQEAMNFDAVTEHVMDPFRYSEELTAANLLIEWLFDEEEGTILKNKKKLVDLYGTVYPISYESLIWGETNQSGYFDGKNDYVEISDHNRYDFDNSEEFTIETWIKASENQEVQYAAIVGKDDPFDNRRGYALAIEKDYGQVVFKLQAGTVATSRLLRSKSQVTDGDWHHIAVTLQRTNVDPDILSLYVDSVLEDQITAGSFSVANDRPLTIGAVIDNTNIASNYYKGLINDVRLYDTALNSPEIYIEYIEGPDNLNSVSYSLIINNNSNSVITGDFTIKELLPPFLKLSKDMEVFSAPNYKDPEPLASGSILTGMEYTFNYDLDKTPLKPGENMILNFLANIDQVYEDYSLERTSRLKIIGSTNPEFNNNKPSFKKIITALNPNGSTINGGNNIEQGEQAPIQIRYFNNDLSIYEDIVGEQNNSQLGVNTGGSGQNMTSGDEGNYSPISAETPTVNNTHDVEYLRGYKRTTLHPDLALEYLKPSNELNKYFYSLNKDNFDLRIQWQVKDDPSVIDGFRWVQEGITQNQTIAECSTYANNCIGIEQSANTFNFEAYSWSNNNDNRKWKFQDFAESYTLTGGGGDFGESYYFTYIRPKQGRNKFKLKIRDSLLQWGDPRTVQIWTDSFMPVSSLNITGQNEKKKDPINPTDWWREGINSVVSVFDDTSEVSGNQDEVSGIDYLDYRIYSNFDTPPTSWTHVNDNDQGQYGLQARWKFDEGSGQTLNDETTLHHGTISYNAENEFWTENGAGTFNGLNHHVSFNGDLLDLSKKMTIEAWISLTPNSSNDGVLLSKWDNASNNSYKVEIGTDNELHFFTSQNGSAITESNSIGANLIDGDYHIVIMKDGPFVKYYVNGVLVGTKNSVTENIYNSNGNFYIGKDDSQNPVHFHGKIKELRIYQQNFEEDVVTAHYNEGEYGAINSHSDNNALEGFIDTEFNKNQSGIWNIDYKTEDRATPPNETGVQTHQIKIDKDDPITSAIEGDVQNIQLGANGWWKSLGTNGQGIMKVDFQVLEGVQISPVYFGSGLKKLNFVHQINDQGPENFTIDWDSSMTIKNLLNFSNSVSQGSSSYSSDTTSGTFTCTNGTYPLNITELNLSNVTTDIWIGGCTGNQLTRPEFAKLVTDGLNTNTNLNKFYLVTYNSTAENFVIESLGNKTIIDEQQLSYSNGTWSFQYNLEEDYGYTTSGKHRFYYWSEDIAGNIEEIGSDNILTFYVDTIKPPCPQVGSLFQMPNAYAYKGATGISSTYRDNSLINYVTNGYLSSAVLIDGLMDANARQAEKFPYFMWPKSIDQGVNASGDVKYSYLWEKAEAEDFNANGTISATQPNNPANFSPFTGIGTFDLGDNTSILSAHEGALFPYSGPNGDDIPDPQIQNSDDGDSFFLWLKVKDSAGNENWCGQPGSDGVGPVYVYNYGTAIKFITRELFDSNIHPIELSSDLATPTKFAAGPFLAGEIINFDQLYYNFESDPYTPVIYGPAEGTYTTNQIVYLVNLAGELSNGDKFNLSKIDDPVNPYPATQIEDSLNLFRPDITLWDQDYFKVEGNPDPNTGLQNANDLYTGDGYQGINTGASNQTLTTPPEQFDPEDKTGRLLNLGIFPGPRNANNISKPDRGKMEIKYEGAGGPETIMHDTFTDPLSDFALGDNPEIIRGFSNVSGRYQLRIALESSEGNNQYMQIEFEILPNEPDFHCKIGECSEMMLNTP
jgi:hypothetical protein